MKEKLEHISLFLLKCIGISFRLWITGVALLGLLIFAGELTAIIERADGIPTFLKILICIFMWFVWLLLGVIFVKVIAESPERIEEAWRKRRK